MDICIKNVDDTNWRLFKSESVKHGNKMGEFFSKLVDEHLKKCNDSNWDEILSGKKTLKGLFTKKDLNKLRDEMETDFSKHIT